MGASGCVFCAIVEGRAASHQVLDGADCVAFLDTRPLFPGHVLVVPREHRETIADLSPEQVSSLFARAREVSMALERALGADGTFVAMNNRVSQSVPHAHVHVVPRKRGDGLRGFFWPRHKYASDAEAAEIAARVRSAIRA